MLTGQCFDVATEVPRHQVSGLNHRNLSKKGAQAGSATTLPLCGKGSLYASGCNQTLDISLNVDNCCLCCTKTMTKVTAVSRTKIDLEDGQMLVNRTGFEQRTHRCKIPKC